MGQSKGKWYLAKDAQARFVQWGHLRSERSVRKKVNHLNAELNYKKGWL